MTAALRQGSVVTEIGPGAILHAFFSTVSANLEPGGWGTRFPKLLNCLYQGQLDESDSKAALSEIKIAIAELRQLGVDRLVWDIERPFERPPDVYDQRCEKTSLFAYFQTTTGRNLASEIKDNIECQVELGGPLEVISYESIAAAFR